MKNKTRIISLLLMVVLAVSLTACNTKEYKSVEMTCVVDGESYRYKVVYDDNYKVISTTDDIEWFNENVNVKDYKDDALELIAHIETTVREAGGTVNHYPIKIVTQ